TPMAHPTPLLVAIFFPTVCGLFSQVREHRALAAARKASSRLPEHRSSHSLVSTLRRSAPMKKFVGLLLCLALSFFIAARAAKPSGTPAAGGKTGQKNATGQKADAETLLDDASKALAAMVKAARADKGLDPKTPKNKPFWKSTQLVANN